MKYNPFVLLSPVIIALSLLACEESNISSGRLKKTTQTEALQNGDIIFQSSSGGQGKAIQIATGSPWSHVGIIYIDQGEKMVFEAVHPVKITPLEEFIKRGDGGAYTVKRLKNASTLLTAEALGKMKKAGQKHLGKNYDLYFGWSDDRIYCSELVWKIYHEALGLQIGKLQKLKDFKLDNPIVQWKLKERYGKKIPYEEKVISPAAIYDSELLEPVRVVNPA